MPRAIVAALLIAVLASGCIKEGYHTPWITIYNRTATPVAFDGGWVATCDRVTFAQTPPWPSPLTTPPPGTPHISFDLGVPSGYVGEVAVIITEQGVEVLRGGIADASLPRCHGGVPVAQLIRAVGHR